MTIESEQLLFMAISKGEERAFKQLFDVYKGKLFGLAVSLTKSTLLAEELVQEVFTSLWISRHVLADVEDPAAYIYQSTYRKLRQLVKKEQHQQLILQVIKEQSALQGPTRDPEVELLLSETKRVLAEAVNLLSDQKRKVYQLAKVEGLSYKEISMKLNISPNTVRNHLVEALRLIREHFTQVGLGSLLPILTILLDR